jgi:hypothetical protein
MRTIIFAASLGLGLLSGCASLVPPPAPRSLELAMTTGISAKAAYPSALAWFAKNRDNESIETYSGDPASGTIRFSGRTELSARDSVFTYVQHRSELRVQDGALRFDFVVERAFSLDFDLSRGMPGTMREDPTYRELRFTSGLLDVFTAKAEALVKELVLVVSDGGAR